jgi:Flp pilus assembly protein TadG
MQMDGSQRVSAVTRNLDKKGQPGRCERGSSLVELALTMPVLITLLLGAIDFGRVFFFALAVTQAASAGAWYGAQSPTKSLDSTGMQTTATASAGDITGFSATASRSCTCWSQSSMTESNMLSCGALCASPSVMRIYVSVTGTGTFNTMVPWPGIPTTVPVTRTAKMRAK